MILNKLTLCDFLSAGGDESSAAPSPVLKPVPVTFLNSNDPLLI